MNTSTEFAVTSQRDFGGPGWDPHSMPKYDADQTTALNTLLKQRCDEAGCRAQGRHGHRCASAHAAQPREGGATARMSLQAGHAEAQRRVWQRLLTICTEHGSCAMTFKKANQVIQKSPQRDY